jgi:hypothetical protein
MNVLPKDGFACAIFRSAFFSSFRSFSDLWSRVGSPQVAYSRAPDPGLPSEVGDESGAGPTLPTGSFWLGAGVGEDSIC